MIDKITMIELFSGIGAQERALRQFGFPYEVTNTCDCDKDAVLSYAAMRWDLEKEMETFEFPSQDKMIEELQAKNLGYDFQKGKYTITTKTPLPKLKQYYIADKLSKNLGDISLVESLPYSDIATYSFPCTDLSVAGKGEGMVNKCDGCGYSWPIDFSNAEETIICPECGAEVSSSTRSGLLGQVQRLLAVAKEDGTLPKYLLLENVKNLIGKKFIGQFEAWVKWLDSIGYNTYYKVLNGKHYKIPQNRERVFAISIRKDVDTKGFIFPEAVPLTTRLKDMLEKNVDEKYYLPDDRIEKILNSTFMQEKKRIQMSDVCDTLLARDWKDPKCVPVEEDISPIRIGNIYDENYGTGYAGNVWDKDGVSPTLQTAQGGNRMPLVLEEEPFIVASRGRNPENPSDRTPGAPTEQRLEPNFSGCTNTLTSVQKDNYVCEPQIIQNPHGFNKGSVQEECPSITSSYFQENNYVAEPIIYDDYNSRISADQDAINTLTCNCGASAERNGVKIIEPIVCEERKDEGIRLFKDDCVGTLRTIDACGDKRVLEPELMIEDIVFPVMVRKYPVDVEKLKATLRKHKCYSNKEIAEKLNKPLTLIEHWFRQDECFAIPDADMWLKLRELLNITTNEFDESIMTFEVKDGVYDKANRCYHIEGIAPTLTAASANEKIIEPQPKNIKWRIRKLTPKCCWRLMGFTDEDHDRAAKYTSASARYKMAGNSIITSCLIAIFSSLFIEDGHKAEVWTKYLLNYND